MTRDGFEAHYRGYIACLNERRIDEAAAYYLDDIWYNGERMTREQWRKRAIEDSFRAIPDLLWQIEQVVIEGDTIAVRLVDTGILKQDWQGLKATGRSASFGENVFYRFRDKSICEVWSIVDLTALRRAAK